MWGLVSGISTPLYEALLAEARQGYMERSPKTHTSCFRCPVRYLDTLRL